MAEIPSAFKPYVVDIGGLSASKDVAWTGKASMHWWGEGFVTLRGWIKVWEHHATPEGETISDEHYTIESGQTRTFTNPSGQGMVIFLEEIEGPPPPPPPPPPPGKFSWNGFKGVVCYGDQVDLQGVKDAGFNSVVCYNPVATANILDDALAKGIWVLPWLGEFLQRTTDLPKCIDYIHAHKNHSAIGAWYFLDEPELFSSCTKANQIAWRNAIKAEDPNHDLYIAFTQNPRYPNDHYEPAAFDHLSCTIYPLFEGWPPWEVVMNQHCSNFNSHVGGIPAGAVTQGYYEPDLPAGNPLHNPTGLIDDFLAKMQSYGIGVQAQGYAMYIWTDGYSGTSRGVSQDAALLAHVTAVNASYDWPHAPPGGEIPEETFTTEEIICSQCGSTLKVTISSISENNSSQNCPVCGLSEVARGTKIEIIHAEPWPKETFTTEDITCSTCSSVLKVTISSISEHNLDLLCPICEAPIRTGTKVEIVSTPIIDQLRADITALDTTIAELEAKANSLRTQINTIKDKLGL